MTHSKPNCVLVLDAARRPLDPCHPARARELLRKGKAAVFRRYPFPLILKREYPNGQRQAYEVKLDPGAKVTGIAIVRNEREVIWAGELEHRGFQIRAKLTARRASRRLRRARLRSRAPRFLNRRRPAGWLPPSLRHRVETTWSWVNRFRRWLPTRGVAMERVRFDMQKLMNAEIAGVEYQQGELAGYELREYVLEKWGRQCGYCGKKDTPLELDHIEPKSKGGSNRASNFLPACRACNQRKGNRPVEAFLKRKPELLGQIQAKRQQPLAAAAAVNATRQALFFALGALGLALRTGTGGQTKFNRRRLNIEKSHWADAACVGEVETLVLKTERALRIKCKGQGGRQKAALDKYGYPIRHNPLRPIHGWRSGDMAECLGRLGRVTPRTTKSFCLTPFDGGKPFSRNMALFRRVHRFDGYAYA